MRIAALSLRLEDLPKFLLPLKKILPFHLGFSGQSDLEMSMSGTWDHLAFQGNWDITPMLLSYGRYFSKPKDTPSDLAFDFLIKKGGVLTGDFSAKVENLVMKATTTDWDLRTGHGRINLITNKFNLEGWEKLVPLLEKYQIKGLIKILLNAEGNLFQAHEAKTALNLTLEQGELAREGVPR